MRERVEEVGGGLIGLQQEPIGAADHSTVYPHRVRVLGLHAENHVVDQNIVSRQVHLGPPLGRRGLGRRHLRRREQVPRPLPATAVAPGSFLLDFGNR